MKIRHFLIAALMTLSLPALAQFTTIERAYEVPLTEFTVPVTRNGIINIWQCEKCELARGRLTTQTQFRVNRQSVELQEFRKQVFSVRNRDAVTVIVKHHLESDTITSISVSL